MIGKNADNVEHLEYWLRVYHFSFYIRQAFCKFRWLVFISDKLGLYTNFK